MKVSYTVILEYLISVFFIHEEKPFYKIFLNYSNLTLKILIKPYNMIFFIPCYFTHTFVCIFRKQQRPWPDHVLLMTVKNNQLSTVKIHADF